MFRHERNLCNLDIAKAASLCQFTCDASNHRSVFRCPICDSAETEDNWDRGKGVKTEDGKGEPEAEADPASHLNIGGGGTKRDGGSRGAERAVGAGGEMSFSLKSCTMLNHSKQNSQQRENRTRLVTAKNLQRH